MEWTLLGRAALAIALTAVIGWDRERLARPAGLRTHMLVGLSSALFVGIAQLASREAQPEHVDMDPLRVLEAVAAGVSFLGAGTVFFSRHRGVQGLTTGASLWTAGAVGVAAGLGHPLLATGSTVLALLVLLSARLEKDDAQKSKSVEEPVARGEAGDNPTLDAPRPSHV
jgi:putative Mg2+ transporter-C (MgtC) family protein